MALQQRLYACVCTCLLLAAVASAARGPIASAQPPLGSVEAQEDCTKTVDGVPRWCGAEFLRATIGGDKSSMSNYCCELLSCVREWTCEDRIRTVCPRPDYGNCHGRSSSLEAHC